MSYVNPSFAAKLSAQIYTLDNQFTYQTFIQSPEFSRGSGSHKAINAEIGSRLISTSSQFAICIRGTGQYKDDLFLIFRGTVELADVVTDARMGLNVSSTGSLVHSGFNHAFNSMKVEMAQFIRQQKGSANINIINVSWVTA